MGREGKRTGSGRIRATAGGVVSLMGVHDDSFDLQKPHDALFQAAFSDPARAAELVRSVVSPAIAAAIDWSTLKRIDASFIDPELREHHGDLVFEVEANGRPVLIYMLYEHKAYPAPFLLLQVLRYKLRLWERFRAENPQAERLPPILPYVLYHGLQAWREPPDFHGRLDLDGLPPELVAMQLQFRIALDDLTATDANGLHRRRLSLASLLPLLHLQQVRRHQRIVRLIARWRRLYRRLQRDYSSGHLFRQLVTYVVAVSDEDPMTLRDAFAKVGKPAEETVMTCAERIRQQAVAEGRELWRNEGLRLGLKQGLQQGMQQGQVELLRNLLEHRFGPLPDAQRRQLADGSTADFERWSRAVLDARTLADVFAS